MGVLINNRYYKNVNFKYTILQFCLSVNITVPFFCYHESLNIAGNCRMCLVEVNNLLVASCAINICDNMVISTNNNRVRIARESVLEFLLVNHPLDCPICDQGGECDLQDISLTYGSDKGRFYEKFKRSVDNLNCCGPLIKTIMTRCIHCTRCVRFVNEISNNFNLGVIGRGSSMEIGTYLEKYLNDELIGNIIDLCPVGALTSMPFSFKTRVWKLTNIRSIDVLDSIASSIRIDTHCNNIMRVVPNLDGTTNEEWITNKARFSFDSLNIQRINNPKISYNLKFIIISWSMAIPLYLYKLYNIRYGYIQAFCGPFFDLLGSCYIKKFFNNFGCSNINFYDNSSSYSIHDFKIFYLLNKSLMELENINNFFFIGSNPRMELPLLNVRLRKNYLENKNMICYSLGLALNYTTFPIRNLGNSMKNLTNFIEGKFYLNFLIFFYDLFNINYFNQNNIIKIFFFFGMSILNRVDANDIIYSFFQLCKELSYDYLHLNILSKFLGRICSYEIGNLPGINSNMINNNLINNYININHYCGIDFDISKNYDLKMNNINIYQGPFFINKFMKYIWLMLPTNVYSESYYFYINLEGRYRFTQKAITPTSKIYNDWKIFKVLDLLKTKLIANNFSIINKFYDYFDYFRNLIDYLNFSDNKYYYNFTHLQKNYKRFFIIEFLWLSKFKIINSIILKNTYNYYLSDPISRNSKILNLTYKYDNIW
jgi:NADH-quinone oxidoreductase subunit G